MIRITLEEIKKSATSSTTYARGMQYYKAGLVQNLVNDMEKRTIYTRVNGGSIYRVEIKYDTNGSVARKSCSCPASGQYWGDCKHITAVLLKAMELFGVPPVKTPLEVMGGKSPKAGAAAASTVKMPESNHALSVTRELISSIIRLNEYKSAPKEPVRMKFTIHMHPVSYSNAVEVEIGIGLSKLYSVKDLRDLFDCIYYKKELNFGKTFTYNPSLHIFNDSDRAVLNYLIDVYRHNGITMFSGYSTNKRKRIKVAQERIRKFLELAGSVQDAVLVKDSDGDEEKFSVKSGKPHFGLDIQYKDLQPELVLNAPSDLVILGRDHDVFFSDGVFYLPEKEDAENIKNVLYAFEKVKNGRLPLPEEEIPALISGAVPVLERTFSLRISKELNKRICKEPLMARAWLDKPDDGISCRLVFSYGSIEINPFKEAGPAAGPEDVLLVRNLQKEKEILDMLAGIGFFMDGDFLYMQEDDRIYDFLSDGITRLALLAETYYSDAFGRLKIASAPRIRGSVELDEDMDFLEVSFDIEGIAPEEIKDFMKALREKRRYYRFRDGSFLSMESEGMDAAARLLAQLGADGLSGTAQALSSQGTVKLPKHSALYLDQAVREYGREHFSINSPFKQMVKNIREPQELEFELPGSLKDVLRDYQKTGFKWLKALSYYGFGGILADDMGLGKTLQAITLMLSDYPVLKRPALVIAPTSLVYNWQDEINKFAPGLPAMVVDGSRQEREELLKQAYEHAFVITSYALIRRDIDEIRKIPFSYCFLDEAQQIKNPDTVNAKSVKQVNARRFFAMTGTPVENSLTEMWSIFDFVMPGYLYSHSEFQSRFETPIVKNTDKKALEDLKRHIRPFILRRMKKDVLTELPDKIETKSLCEMTDAQKKVYLNYLSKARKVFEDEISANGFEKSRIKILALLTRLRQICCHPSVFIENYSGGSGKLDALEELITDALEAGHRILLFSQFTSMLSIIRCKLDEMGCSSLYLDGNTDPEERIRLVNAFNGGEAKVFLISLKAGGTGLNLTGADTVIHYDPWWNPAVEDQATDRAYRIGQKRSVQVFRLIARGSIEEKIYMLQEKKKELIGAVLQPGENFIGKLSLQDIRGLFEA